MPYCPHCGQQMLVSEDHCPACGQSLSQPPSPSPLTVKKPGPASLPLGEYLKTGWELFKRYPGGFVGFLLVYLVIQLVLNFIPWIGGVAAIAIGPALIMGFFIVSAKLLQNRTPQFADFFLGFKFFLPLLLAALVGGVLTAIGLLLLIIPGIYLMVSYLFAQLLVIDRRLDFWPALEFSRRTVQPIWFQMFAFLLLLMLINLAGGLALGIGLLVSVPLTGCAMTVAYAEIFGLQSEYSEDFPDNVASETQTPQA